MRNTLKDRRVKLPEVRKVGADDIPSFEDIRKLMLYLHGPRPTTTGQHKLTWAQRLPMVALRGVRWFASRRVHGFGLVLRRSGQARDLGRLPGYNRVYGIKGPKSKAGVRTVPMKLRSGTTSCSATRRWLGQRDRCSAMGEEARTAPMILSGRQLKASMDGAGVSGFSFHGLRHFALGARGWRRACGFRMSRGCSVIRKSPRPWGPMLTS